MKVNYDITQESDNITYIDINVQNNSPNRVPASFLINRTSSFLSEPNEKYFASVIRFTIPLTSQPLFMYFNNANIVSITKNGITATSTLVFQKTDFNGDQLYQIQPPDVQLAGAVYQYQTLANMVNVALADCCTQLGIVGQIPYMAYDCNTLKFTVYAPTSWADVYPYTNTAIPHIFFNKLLQTYFVNFNNISYDNSINNNNLDYLVIIQNLNNNVVAPNPLNPTEYWLTNCQEWDGVQYTNSLNNISIVSNALPYAGNSLNNIRMTNNFSQSGSIKSISDFELNKAEGGSSRSLVQYASQNNRYLDLVGNNKITSLDMSIYCFYEELIDTAISPYQQLIMNPYEVITLKLMFKKKSLNY